MSTIHKSSIEGFSKGAVSYVKGRPSYAEDAVRHIVSQLSLVAGNKVVDLGAGTGKFTELLARNTEASVIAVEPVKEMALQIPRLPNITVLEGDAERIPLETSSVRGVACAQAFHWFATKPALAEMHRVIAPGGKLALIWNTLDCDIEWQRLFNQFGEELYISNEAPRHQTGKWAKVFEKQDLFDPPQLATFSYSQEGDLAVMIDRVLSRSVVAQADDEEKAKIRQRVVDLFTTHPDLKGKAVFELLYDVHVYIVASRKRA